MASLTVLAAAVGKEAMVAGCKLPLPVAAILTERQAAAMVT
jgi:hypothetical protein